MSSLSVVAGVVEWAYFRNAAEISQQLQLSGCCFIIVGIVVRVWAIQVLGKQFTATATLQTTTIKLYKAGPYKFVRHPSYLGAFLAIIGSAVFLNAYVCNCYFSYSHVYCLLH